MLKIHCGSVGRHTKTSHGGHGGTGRLETGVRGVAGPFGCAGTHRVAAGDIGAETSGEHRSGVHLILDRMQGDIWNAPIVVGAPSASIHWRYFDCHFHRCFLMATLIVVIVLFISTSHIYFCFYWLQGCIL